MSVLSYLAAWAELASFIGVGIWTYLLWASGYLRLLTSAARARGWGFRRSPLPAPSDSGDQLPTEFRWE